MISSEDQKYNFFTDERISRNSDFEKGNLQIQSDDDSQTARYSLYNIWVYLKNPMQKSHLRHTLKLERERNTHRQTERDREKQRDRQIEKKTERWTDRQIKRGTKKETEVNRQRHSEREREEGRGEKERDREKEWENWMI